MDDLLFSIWGSDPDLEEESKPGVEVDVLEEEQEDEKENTPWRVILYDDDIHTFDEVITQLIKALKCNKSHAKNLTYKVHNEGKANVYEGSFEDCFQVNGVLKEIQLITEIKG
ncbi:ATP-dependent Clp protease adaptor ClpS [Fodinibius saliphilus]|uniref:ATP-dependent Clp protease adaptor ClpS n=1 Tax=Fodinibius saliphilus TaxID=1920650 RepID=UPI001109FF6B|nr:ATP-dependent Clp protease adaptor ClpS [Fodinibius saliphilus]